MTARSTSLTLTYEQIRSLDQLLTYCTSQGSGNPYGRRREIADALVVLRRARSVCEGKAEPRLAFVRPIREASSDTVIRSEGE